MLVSQLIDVLRQHRNGNHVALDHPHVALVNPHAVRRVVFGHWPTDLLLLVQLGLRNPVHALLVDMLVPRAHTQHLAGGEVNRLRVVEADNGVAESHRLEVHCLLASRLLPREPRTAAILRDVEVFGENGRAEAGVVHGLLNVVPERVNLLDWPKTRVRLHPTRLVVRPVIVTIQLPDERDEAVILNLAVEPARRVEVLVIVDGVAHEVGGGNGHHERLGTCRHALLDIVVGAARLPRRELVVDAKVDVQAVQRHVHRERRQITVRRVV